MRAQLKKQINQFTSVVVALVFSFNSLLIPGSVAAQSVDFESPTIEMTEVQYGAAGEAQVFIATIIDNESVADVVFNYRMSGDGAFTESPMANTTGAEYKISLSETYAEGDIIEYYIAAADETGNRTLKGFEFAPLTREISSSAAEQFALEATEEKPKKLNLLYVALGVLALGALAGAAAGGGGSSDDGGVCPADGCTFTLSIPGPQ